MIYLFVLLLRIVAFLEGTPKIISFIVVFSIIGYSTIKRTPFKDFRKVSKAKLYSFLLIIFILIHGLIFGIVYLRDFAVLLTYWLWFVFTYTYMKEKTLEEGLRYVFFSFLIFNIANYIFFEMYYADQKRGINTIMEFLGILGYRMYFPLSSGANVFTFQLGLNALLSLYFIKIKKKNFLYIIAFWFYLFILVLADSRLILSFTIIFSFVYWLSFKTLVIFFKRYWYIISLSIIGFIFVFYNTNLFDSIKRPAERTGDVISRIDIWGHALEILVSDFKLIFGHGLNGLENSLEEGLKSRFEEQSLQTSHNFIIQNIIDFGLVGIVVILFYVFKLINMLIKIKSEIVTIMIVMFLLIGTTESIPTFYSFEATIFVIAIISVILVIHERKTTRYNQNINSVT
ncbi:O-antigen ligase family protein [Winogradskyella sp.]|uniref:O-antigen ligase family protein n=4 Tax=Winogradskyella sp. TaxID=1883156 RepID=UPI00351257E4